VLPEQFEARFDELVAALSHPLGCGFAVVIPHQALSASDLSLAGNSEDSQAQTVDPADVMSITIR
jgi:hypothetical protein